MTAALDFLNTFRGILDHFEHTQLMNVERAAVLVADSVLNGGTVHLAAIGHSNEQDFINRAGGPAFLQPLSFSLNLNDPVAECLKERPRPEPFDREVETVRLALKAGNLRPGDIVAVGSVSGRNVRPVAIALTCREMGIRTLAFTSLAYTAKVASAHPSGKKLAEVADVVIDNGAPYGDAAVTIPGYDIALLPVSGASMVVAGWLVWGRAMELMAAKGKPASAFMSVNRPDGQDYYNKSLARYQKQGY